MSTIRVATIADAPALAELAAATFELACPPNTTAAAVAEFLRDVLSESNFRTYLEDPNRLVFVAEFEGRLLGYTVLVFGDPGDSDVQAVIRIRPTVEVSKCYVRAGSHGGGLASSLMAATLHAAGERGAVGAWLGVNELNARAIRFYEKQGFAEVGRKTFPLGGVLENDFVLERAL
ncbi:GNAT family N-acetyltransferase [Cryobacterium psychrophilum]|uniref:GNAT family N-acetyltransferase n=1 Tax=Cryobacterium psychrophilum TaxID=41988 RepID=A0A4Y8KN59_9MICO|nr:GNAT family N-acetyltransferase [Cryobacterium psychrophilum]TDW30442.1 ribosomal protein S18 acetylase RimI-like enzyme [Cryobacterium psychrophilum]TFD79522.1 GNAT family N-acetyltransferase [Cryobacterium psychrophilum]